MVHSAYNASVLEFLVIVLYPILIYSSLDEGCFLSCAIIEHKRWYLSIIECLIESSKSFLFDSEHMAVLYYWPLFNQPVLLNSSISYNIALLGHIIHNIPTWYNIVFNTD